MSFEIRHLFPEKMDVSPILPKHSQNQGLLLSMYTADINSAKYVKAGLELIYRKFL